jgi:hypothetical protein
MTVKALLLALCLAGVPRAAYAEDGAGPASIDRAWGPALQAYARNGGATSRRRLLTLARRTGTEDLPPIFLLAIADAQMRSGHSSAAASMFDRVLVAPPPSPWGEWAHLGLGWLALQAGDLATARRHLAVVAASGVSSTAFASMMIGLVDAAEGRPQGAVTAFDRVAERTDASPELRLVAKLSGAYARYWNDDDAGAQARFAAVIAADPGGPLADDAAYGIARSELRVGDRARATSDLHDLARGSAPVRGGTPDSPGFLDLEPQAMLRVAFRRYRRLPLAPPETHSLAMFDGDGTALARGLLARMAVPAESRPLPATGPVPDVLPADAPSRVAPPAHGPSPGVAAPVAGAATESAETGSRAWLVMLVVAGALLLGGVGWMRRGGERRRSFRS